MTFSSIGYAVTILVFLVALFPQSEPQQFGGCQLCSRQLSYSIPVRRERTTTYQYCTGVFTVTCQYRTRLVTYYQLETRYWTKSYCCLTSSTGQSGDGTLRLAGGESDHSGKLEIFHQTSYGGICSANFGAEESRVACFQLGFGGASRYYDYGSSQQTLLNSLSCQATGTWLANCTHGGWRTGVCSNGQAVGLECADSLGIRLTGGSSKFQGRVEHHLNGAWGTVCNKGWDIDDATVVCRELGFGAAVQATTGHTANSIGIIMLSNVDCTGNETGLRWCAHSGWRSSNCTYSNHSGVVCEGPTATNLTVVSITSSMATVTFSVPDQLKYSAPPTAFKLVLQSSSGLREEQGTTQELQVTNLSPNTEYSVKVKIVVGQSEGPHSASVTFTTSSTVPGPLQSFSASTQSPTSISLSWSPPVRTNGQLTGYDLRYQSDTFGDARTVVLSPNTTSYVIQGLEEDTEYRITLSAVNSVGTGESLSTSIKTPIDVPSEAPRDFSSSVVNSSAITLQWQSPSTRHHNGPLLYFVVYYSSYEDSLQISVSVRNDTTHYEYVVGDLDVYTNYTFTIVARNMAGNGPSSTLWNRTQEDVPGLVASMFGEPLSPTSVLVGWTPPTHPNGIVTGYRIQYSRVDNGSTESSLDVHAASINLTLSELSPSTRYRVSVAAQTSIGVGQVTTIELVTDSSALGTPIGFSVRPLGPTVAGASWRPPNSTSQDGGTVSYVIKYHIAGDSDEVFEVNITMNYREEEGIEHQYNITGLSSLTTYKFYIRADLGDMMGTFTSARLLRTPATVPSSPVHFTAHSLSSTNVLLTWSPPTVVSGGIRGYHITCISLHSTINDTRSVFTTASEGNQYTFSNLEEDVWYRFSNYAENDAGSGEPVFATAKTKPDKPTSSPRELHAKETNATTVVLQWRPPLPSDWNGNITHHEIHYHCQSMRYNVSRDLVAGDSALHNHTHDRYTYIVTGLEPAAVCRFKLASVNNQGRGPYSSDLVVSLPADIPSKVAQLKWISLTNSSIALEWESPYRPNGNILSYKVYVNGTLVHVVSANETNTTLSNLPMGVHQVAVSASTEAGEGELASLAVPLMVEETPPPNPTFEPPTDDNNIVLIAGISAGLVIAVILIIIMIIVIIVVCVCCRMRKGGFHLDRDGQRVDQPGMVIYRDESGGEPEPQYEEVDVEQVYDNPSEERRTNNNNYLESSDGGYVIMNGSVSNEEVTYSVPRRHDSSRNQLLKQQQPSAENPCFNKLDCTLLEDSGTHSRYASPSPPTPNRVSTLPSPLNNVQVRTMPSTNSCECNQTSNLSDSSDLPPPMALTKPRGSSPPAAALNSTFIQQRNEQYSSTNPDRPLLRIPPRPACPNDMGKSPSAISNHYSNPQVPSSSRDIPMHPPPTQVPVPAPVPVPVPRPRKPPSAAAGQPITSRPEPEGRQNSIDLETVYLNYNVHAHDHMYNH